MDKKSIQKFLKFTVENLLPEDVNQEQCGIGKDYWNADYWTMEVAACLYLEQDYVVPEGFKHNKNYDMRRIFMDAEKKEFLFNILNDIKDDADVLLVCEVGRGLDILVANMVKSWKKIYCYDQVNYSTYLSYFDNDIEFYHKTTSAFDPSIIPENVIMIMNHSILKSFENKNIVHAIVDGEQKW